MRDTRRDANPKFLPFPTKSRLNFLLSLLERI